MQFFFHELPLRARFFVVATIATGASVAAYSLYRTLLLPGSPQWLYIIVATALSTFFLVRLPCFLGGDEGKRSRQRIQSMGFTVADVFVFSAIFFFSPEVAVLVGLTDGILASAQILQRQRAYRFFFNLAQISIVVFLVGKLFYSLQETTAPLQAEQVESVGVLIMQVALCAILYFSLNSMAVAAAISLSGAGQVSRLWVQNFSWAFVFNLGGALVALAIFFTLRDFQFLALSITAAFILIVFHSYRMMNKRIRELLGSKKFLQSALDSLGSFIAVLDHNGHIIAVNQAWQQPHSRAVLFGSSMPVGEDYLLVCRTLVSEIPAAAELAHGIRDVISGRRSDFALEYHGQRETIGWFQVKVTRFEGQEPVRVVVAHQDITDMKVAEERLRESEESYRSFFEDDLTGDFHASPGGTLERCNPAFARMLGFSSLDDALGSNFFAFISDPARAEEQRRLLLQQQKLEYCELELDSAVGEKVCVVANIIGRFDANGELEAIQGYLFDDTVRKKLETELQQAQKMEAVGRMAGGIAHDFNNILTVISGYGESLRDALVGSPELREEADMILEASQHAGSVTRKLLAFSRRQFLQIREANLNEIVDGMRSVLQSMVKDDIQLRIQLDDAMGSVRVDSGEIERVIANLVINACDAMPQGGTVQLETLLLQLDHDFVKEFGPLASGRYACLLVRDSGEGMDAETKSRIFEPFFTTKTMGLGAGGNGLGLSTVYGIVKQCKGHIEVRSKPGEGTTFQIYLPLAGEKREESTTRPPRPAEPGGSEMILVVEDQEKIRKLVTAILSRHGYRVHAVSNGVEALDWVNQTVLLPDLILTDVVMPEMGGWELVEKLRASRLQHVPVIYVSGYPEMAEGSEARLGLNEDFLPKPFTPEVLLRTIRRILDPSNRHSAMLG